MGVWPVREGAWQTELLSALSSVASQLTKFERERLWEKEHLQVYYKR